MVSAKSNAEEELNYLQWIIAGLRWGKDHGQPAVEAVKEVL